MHAPSCFGRSRDSLRQKIPPFFAFEGRNFSTIASALRQTKNFNPKFLPHFSGPADCAIVNFSRISAQTFERSTNVSVIAHLETVQRRHSKPWNVEGHQEVIEQVLRLEAKRKNVQERVGVAFVDSHLEILPSTKNNATKEYYWETNTHKKKNRKLYAAADFNTAIYQCVFLLEEKALNERRMEHEKKINKLTPILLLQ